MGWATLGPYRLERELGAGGMGKVWAARVEGRVPGLDVGALVALKLVHPHLLETPGFFERFLREAQIGKAVAHENVVRTFDCGSLSEDGKRADFLVMEYVEGQTLRALLAELERVPEELCRHIGREAAKGLAAIHAAGVVHRDVKPENVIITKDHAVKVMDLGVARLMDETTRLSQTGAFVGSLHYAAPEAFREGGRHVDGRADLHALGLVLYELACGVNPYFAADVPQTLRKVLHETPRRLGDVNPQLSPFFEEVVHTLLAKAPADRFPDAQALAAVFDDGESSPWWTSRASAMRAQTHRPLRRMRIPRETAVHGRDAELAGLRALFAKAKAGDGQVVLVEGEAGIGKSRVVDELIGRLEGDGEDLNFLSGGYPPGGAATAAGAFAAAFREQFGADGAAACLAQSPVLVPAFDALLRGEPTPEGREPLTKDSLQTCFVHAARGLASERTTVLLVDDLHFAPEDARSLFASLAMAVPGHRILLIGTTRPGADEKWVAGLTRLPQTSRMSLQRLGPKDLARLLEDSLKSESLALSLAGRIGLKSDGNPFFVFEIVRGLRDGLFLTQRDDGTWATSRVIDDIAIPSSVLDLVNARAADLTPDERELLDVAACWGFEFQPLLVGDVLGLAPIPLLRTLGHIEKKHGLVRACGRRYVFDHHQVQEALHGAMSELLRESYHAALASALETRTGAATQAPASLDGAVCVDLAEHFLAGAQGARALRYLDAAMTHLSKGWLNDVAVRLADRALAVPSLVEGEARCELLLRKAVRLDLLARRDAQAAALEEARTLADAAQDVGLRAKTRSAQSRYLNVVSRFAEAESAARETLELARASGDRSAESAATGNLGINFHDLGRHAEAQEQHERALSIAREIGDRQSEANAAANLGIVCFSLGRHREAQAHYELALSIAREIGDRQGEVAASGNLASIFNALGRQAQAQAHLERSLALAREIGSRRAEATFTGNLGNVFAALGRHAEAQAQFERHLALAREIGDRRGEAVALVNLGPAWRRLGNLPRARDVLDASLALCREIGARYPEGYALLGLGETADEEGDAARALARTEESLALRRAIGHGDGVADSLLALADLRRRAGDADGARCAAEEAVSLSRGHGRRAQAALGLALLAGLPGGDAHAADAELAEAGESDHSLRTRFLLWQATRDRADLAEAKRLLDDALAKNVEHRDAMLANVRLHREVVAAAKADGP
jgi:tetratricopeptide (TPR) repeat protein